MLTSDASDGAEQERPEDVASNNKPQKLHLALDHLLTSIDITFRAEVRRKAVLAVLSKFLSYSRKFSKRNQS